MATLRSAKTMLRSAALTFLGITTVCVGQEAEDLIDLSIEQLMQLKVVSASKQEQPVADTAAAVFVITADDIRRSGVTSVMEALRLAPGVEAVRLDASRWAISIRGFNGRFANKLLVLIDGRSIYNSQFSGVYWESHDVPLDNIERIEVIRGPGGSLWGANAVNGVINIITKDSQDTQGGQVALTAGDEERAIADLRYGGKLGDDAHYRVYGQFAEHDSQVTPDGRDAGDDWRVGKGGFRMDWTPSARDTVTVQGDYYEGNFDQNFSIPTLVPPYAERQIFSVETSGGNLLARWEHQNSATSQMALQAYYQQEDRQEFYIVDASTFDLDFQHNFALGDHQEIVWGLGYRRNWDHYTETEIGTAIPEKKTTDLWSAFIQDQIDLIPERLRLTGGVKIEHNDFTGWEWQPSVRLLWTPHVNHRIWTAVSRAVRTPGRGEQTVSVDLFVLPPSPLTGNLPTLLRVTGSDELDSEKLTAYEIGYRTRLAESVSIDATAFYNDYEDVISAVFGQPSPGTRISPPHLVAPFELRNVAAGNSYGFELATDWRPIQSWRLRLAYTYLDSDFKQKNSNERVYTNGRRHQISLFSSWNLRDDLDLDLWWRYLDTNETATSASPSGFFNVESYSNLNVRLGWRPYKNVEFSLVGANLLDESHFEYQQEAYAFPVEVERSLYGQLKWSF